MRILLLVFTAFLVSISGYAQQRNEAYLLKPDRVFDGYKMHKDWIVITQGNEIIYTGLEKNMPKTGPATTIIELVGSTLLPGLIEGHGHILLHPYNETSWNDQVLKEPEAYRVAMATVHAQKTLEAGFTTFRDLGTEGAGYADYGIKKAIEGGVIPGPRMIISSKAIVATGSYGPKGFSPDFDLPLLGAEAADGANLATVVRTQIEKGADFIKVYADYRWGPNKEAMPTFSEDELRLIVETARSSGRDVVAHAVTSAGMRRSINSGVKMIEHGDAATPEIYKLMKDKGVALCPTLAAGYSILTYNGWNSSDPEPENLKLKRKSFKLAMEAGIIISAGGDVGVFAHGTNALELEMMVEYGMAPLDVLASATSTNAALFHLTQLGQIKKGFLADITVVKGDPSKHINDLRNIVLVLQDGKIVIEN